MTALDPGQRAARLEQPLSEAFAVSQKRLAANLAVDLMEVSWTERRPLQPPSALPRRSPWRALLDWLLQRMPARQTVTVRVVVTADGSVRSTASH
jgi:Tfp pilus assembly protein FimV